ncbi:MAG: nicotinate-nucleotide adenylyltransferase [Christensenellaceae bacterium]|jgi:nicotinate-nucleotide adenylyltransferase|nr:nicotinate-nucleotide adenylyltransferase [Christensenellaceae bacterium]
MERVGILGGTFDPIHLGHTGIARAVWAFLGLSRVDFLPAGQPPHKRAIGASPAQRLEMVRLATEGLPFARVNDMEIRREGMIYTFDSLRAYKALEPEAELHYIIGMDTLLQLPSWWRHEEVYPLCAFAVVGRRGQAEGPALKLAGRLREEYAARIEIMPFAGAEISSTELRTILRARGDTSGLLDEKLRAYIEKEGLYLGEDAE